MIRDTAVVVQGCKCQQAVKEDTMIRCCRCKQLWHYNCAEYSTDDDVLNFTCVNCDLRRLDVGTNHRDVENTARLLGAFHLENRNSPPRAQNSVASWVAALNCTTSTTASNDAVSFYTPRSGSPQRDAAQNSHQAAAYNVLNEAIALIQDAQRMQRETQRNVDRTMDEMRRLVASVTELSRTLVRRHISPQQTSQSTSSEPEATASFVTAIDYDSNNENERSLQHQAAQSTVPQSAAIPVTVNVSPINYTLVNAVPAISLQPAPVDRTQEGLNLTSTAMLMKRVEDLPQFDGTDIKLWHRFDATYQYQVRAGVDRDQLVSNLAAALHGVAYELVADRLLWREDPNNIINDLRDHFGDADRVIDMLMNDIVNAKPPRELPRHELLDFAVLVKRFVTNLNHFGRQEQLSSIYLERVIVIKLRDEHKDQWCAIKRQNPRANIREMCHFLLERSKDFSAEPPAINQQVKKQPQKLAGHHDARFDSDHDRQGLDPWTVGHIQSTGQQDIVRQCFECDGNHCMINCKIFLNKTVQDRINFVRRRNICTGCLTSNEHSSDTCKKIRRCAIKDCNHLHHWLLHNDAEASR